MERHQAALPGHRRIPHVQRRPRHRRRDAPAAVARHVRSRADPRGDLGDARLRVRGAEGGLDDLWHRVSRRRGDLRGPPPSRGVHPRGPRRAERRLRRPGRDRRPLRAGLRHPRDRRGGRGLEGPHSRRSGQPPAAEPDDRRRARRVLLRQAHHDRPVLRGRPPRGHGRMAERLEIWQRAEGRRSCTAPAARAHLLGPFGDHHPRREATQGPAAEGRGAPVGPVGHPRPAGAAAVAGRPGEPGGRVCLEHRRRAREDLAARDLLPPLRPFWVDDRRAAPGEGRQDPEMAGDLPCLGRAPPAPHTPDLGLPRRVRRGQRRLPARPPDGGERAAVPVGRRDAPAVRPAVRLTGGAPRLHARYRRQVPVPCVR